MNSKALHETLLTLHQKLIFPTQQFNFVNVLLFKIKLSQND